MDFFLLTFRKGVGKLLRKPPEDFFIIVRPGETLREIHIKTIVEVRFIFCKIKDIKKGLDFRFVKFHVLKILYRNFQPLKGVHHFFHVPRQFLRNVFRDFTPVKHNPCDFLAVPCLGVRNGNQRKERDQDHDNQPRQHRRHKRPQPFILYQPCRSFRRKGCHWACHRTASFSAASKKSVIE